MLLPKSILFSIPLVILQIENDDDRRFVTELYQKYKLNMYYTARRIVKDHHTAEDLVQDSCVVIIEKLDRIKQVEICKQKNYIVSLVRNVSINYITKRDRRSKYSFTADEELLAQQSGPESDVDEGLIRESDIATLKSALLAISERERTILRMKYSDELADSEIAKYLNIQVNSVRQYLTLARRSLGRTILTLNGEQPYD